MSKTRRNKKYPLRNCECESKSECVTIKIMDRFYKTFPGSNVTPAFPTNCKRIK